MNYEVMWDNLKLKIERDLRYYRSSTSQSMEERMENLSREIVCERILDYMQKIENSRT